VIDRAQIAANAAGSLRLEGLEPTQSTRDLVDFWIQGRASDADLREAEQLLLSGGSLDALLTVAAAHPPRQ
jgi:hypothetical protein